MFAIRQIIEDPQEVIPIPPEFRHKPTEVIFLLLDSDETQAMSRAAWFDGYKAEGDIDAWQDEIP